MGQPYGRPNAQHVRVYGNRGCRAVCDTVAAESRGRSRRRRQSLSCLLHEKTTTKKHLVLNSSFCMPITVNFCKPPLSKSSKSGSSSRLNRKIHHVFLLWWIQQQARQLQNEKRIVVPTNIPRNLVNPLLFWCTHMQWHNRERVFYKKNLNYFLCPVKHNSGITEWEFLLLLFLIFFF